MDIYFRKGQRVISEHFGEGTVTEDSIGNQVEVGFSELETYSLSVNDVKLIKSHTADTSSHSKTPFNADLLNTVHFAPGENLYLTENAHES
jgi:hypothetical protein